MASGCKDQEVVEAVVTYCDDRRALIWIEKQKREREVTFKYYGRRFALGDWVAISTKSDDIWKIDPCLTTRVLEIGVVQVQTEVIFADNEENIGHGMIIRSKHFGRVAVFTPFSGIISGRIYTVFVERIPRDHWDEKQSGVHWFVPSNQIPRTSKGNNSIKYSELLGPFTGVVVSTSPSFVFIWTPSLGEGICENDKTLAVGKWISFMADTHRMRYLHINVTFCVVDWIFADPILPFVPMANNLMLTSSILITQWPMKVLVADWIGPVTDRRRVLETAVRKYGVRKMYKVQLRRRKKNVTEPITTWDVCQFLECKRVGIVRFVDTKERIVYVYVPVSHRLTGRTLRVNLEIFKTVPILGDWYLFEIEENIRYWRAISATKCRKLCNTRIINNQLEVETDVELTNEVSEFGHRLALSALFGGVTDDLNKLSDYPTNSSKNFPAWCSAIKPYFPNQPRWRISCYHNVASMMNRGEIPNTLCNNSTKKRGNTLYVGIIVGRSSKNWFIWTPPLGEGICNSDNNLSIGEWIQFRTVLLRTEENASNANIRYIVRRLEKISSCFRSRQVDKTVVVTMELPVPVDYSSLQPPRIPFFGRVHDKNLIFGTHIDAIRGNMIEMDIKHRRNFNEPFTTVWDITFIRVMEPLQRREILKNTKTGRLNDVSAEINDISYLPQEPSLSSQPVSNFNNFSTNDEATCANENPKGLIKCSRYPICGSESNETISSTSLDKESDDYHEGGENNVELDPVICSMQLLFMSKEIREAIKENCKEDYKILCEYFGCVP